MLKGISGRLLEFIESKKLTPSAFASSISTSDNNVRNLLKGSDSRISMLDRIVKRYPELNVDWLLTGRGSMNYGSIEVTGVENYKPEEQKETNAGYEHRLQLAQQKINGLEDMVDTLREHLKDKERFIKHLEQQLKH